MRGSIKEKKLQDLSDSKYNSPQRSGGRNNNTIKVQNSKSKSPMTSKNTFSLAGNKIMKKLKKSTARNASASNMPPSGNEQ